MRPRDRAHRDPRDDQRHLAANLEGLDARQRRASEREKLSTELAQLLIGIRRPFRNRRRTAARTVQWQRRVFLSDRAAFRGWRNTRLDGRVDSRGSSIPGASTIQIVVMWLWHPLHHVPFDIAAAPSSYDLLTPVGRFRC